MKKRSAIVVFAALGVVASTPAISSAQVRLSAHSSNRIGSTHISTGLRTTTPLTPGVNTAINNPDHLAKLEVTMTTTSDWSQVLFSQGYAANSRVISQSGTGSWDVQTAGLSIGGGDATGGVKTTTVDLLYVDTNNSPIQLDLTKGQIGATSVQVKNLTTNAVVASLSDTDQTSADPTHHVSTQVAELTFMGSSNHVLPQVDNRKLVLSFYYPWFSDYKNSGLAEPPANPRSTYDQAGVSSMTAQAKANGVNGFVVSWNGAANVGTQMGYAVKAADQQGQKVTGYLETAMAAASGADPETTTLNWLVQLLQYRNHSSFLKSSTGVPIVFVYSMYSLSSDQWGDLLSQLKDTYGLSVDLVGDASYWTYLPYEWGVHYYGVTASEPDLATYALNTSLDLKSYDALYGGTPKLFTSTVSPGYNDQNLRGTTNPIVPRDNGQRYVDTWNAAMAGEPDWVLVTSWNEWYEDTSIEPGYLSGSSALSITAAESAQWKASK